MSIEAMKQAHDLSLDGNHFAARQVLMKAIEQAENQQPVGWWNGKETAWFEHETDRPVDDCTIPLYTTPPQREWVGLTDHEAIEVRIKCVNTPKELAHLEYGWAVNYARAIEAKLKEKNHVD